MTRTYRSDLLGGLVMVTTFDVTEIFAARNRSLQCFFLLEAAVVAGAAVVVWLVSRRLTHPLTVLTAASARIDLARGVLDTTPQSHASGTRLIGVGEWLASEGAERAQIGRAHV